MTSSFGIIHGSWMFGSRRRATFIKGSGATTRRRPLLSGSWRCAGGSWGSTPRWTAQTMDREDTIFEEDMPPGLGDFIWQEHVMVRQRHFATHLHLSMPLSPRAATG
jgi:hypothetical protein